MGVGLGITLSLALSLGSAAHAGWLHYANAVFEAKGSLVKHPKSLRQSTVMPTDAEEPLICAAYASNSALPDKGKVRVTASIERADGSSETLELKGPVDANLYFECAMAERDIAAGDVVSFAFKFKGMPRLVNNEQRSEFFDVNGVVSTDGQPRLGTIPLGIAASEDGGWLHASNSVFSTDRDRRKHPRSLTETLVMPRDAGSPVICSGYSNSMVQRNRGRVVTRVTVLHGDGSVATLEFAGRVQNNGYGECQDGPALAKGDVVTFEYQFFEMPKLRRAGVFADSAISYSVVSVSGTPGLRVAPSP